MYIYICIYEAPGGCIYMCICIYVYTYVFRCMCICYYHVLLYVIYLLNPKRAGAPGRGGPPVAARQHRHQAHPQHLPIYYYLRTDIIIYIHLYIHIYMICISIYMLCELLLC